MQCVCEQSRWHFLYIALYALVPGNVLRWYQSSACWNFRQLHHKYTRCCLASTCAAQASLSSTTKKQSAPHAIVVYRADESYRKVNLGAVHQEGASTFLLLFSQVAVILVILTQVAIHKLGDDEVFPQVTTRILMMRRYGTPALDVLAGSLAHKISASSWPLDIVCANAHKSADIGVAQRRHYLKHSGIKVHQIFTLDESTSSHCFQTSSVSGILLGHRTHASFRSSYSWTLRSPFMSLTATKWVLRAWLMTQAISPQNAMALANTCLNRSKSRDLTSTKQFCLESASSPINLRFLSHWIGAEHLTCLPFLWGPARGFSLKIRANQGSRTPR